MSDILRNVLVDIARSLHEFLDFAALNVANANNFPADPSYIIIRYECWIETALTSSDISLAEINTAIAALSLLYRYNATCCHVPIPSDQSTRFFVTPTIATNARGRPRFDIEEEQLQFLLGNFIVTIFIYVNNITKT
jgi:hypothetical protein